jgi:hypothetical protein
MHGIGAYLIPSAAYRMYPLSDATRSRGFPALGQKINDALALGLRQLGEEIGEAVMPLGGEQHCLPAVPPERIATQRGAKEKVEQGIVRLRSERLETQRLLWPLRGSRTEVRE